MEKMEMKKEDFSVSRGGSLDGKSKDVPGRVSMSLRPRVTLANATPSSAWGGEANGGIWDWGRLCIMERLMCLMYPCHTPERSLRRIHPFLLEFGGIS